MLHGLALVLGPRSAVSTALLVALALCAARGDAGEVLVGASAFSGAKVSSEERAIRRLLENYVRAIESKDVERFRAVKPNLSPDDERKARKAFESLQSQAIVMTIQSVEVQEAEALVRVGRRDTINGTIVSSFPQSFTLAKTRDDWTIREIGR